MGGGASTASPKLQQYMLQKSEHDVIRLMMPVFYNHTPIKLDEQALALASWNLILSDQSPVFLERKGDPEFHYQSCITFFYDSFYNRLFDIHPVCRHMFKNLRAQGKFLVKMISLSLSELEDPEKFNRNLTKLAEVHYERGVKAVEYGIVGEVLFFVLKNCLGPTVYTRPVHAAWVKVYSRMLQIIVPIAVAHEIMQKSSEKQLSRSAKNESQAFSESQSNSFSTTTSSVHSTSVHNTVHIN